MKIIKETLINYLREMKRKAPGAQDPRHTNRLVEVSRTAQRSDSLARAINQCVLFFALLCTSGANAFAHTATIENDGEHKYKAVRLTPEIYNNANSNLSDILIKDESGENVPYFINSGSLKKYEVDKKTYAMTLINSYVKDSSFYFDYRVGSIPDSDTPATSIELTTRSAGFAKNIELFGSYDNINWEFVQNDRLYSIDGRSKLYIDFNKALKYTHYRFKLGNNLERIFFDSATLSYNYFTQEKIYFSESITPYFNVTEKDKITYINIEGLKNLRLEEVIIDTYSTFKRTARSPFGTGKELYNLSFGDTSYTDTVMPFDGQIPRDDVFTLTINNGDDKPIEINGITVRYYADELVFEGNKNRKYTIYFGADSTKIAPVYDIGRYKREILEGVIDRVEIKEVVLGESKKEPEQYDYKIIFNVVVVIVAVALGFLILVKFREKPS